MRLEIYDELSSSDKEASYVNSIGLRGSLSPNTYCGEGSSRS